MWRWPKIVATDTQKISMQFDPDARLAAAAGGVARYFADAAGLANGAVSDMQAAIISVCKQEIDRLQGHDQRLEVTLTRSPQRIEVAVTRPLAGATSSNQVGKPESFPGVDRVQHETAANREVIRLTKFVSESASGD
jgi:hypothetical protein